MASKRDPHSRQYCEAEADALLSGLPARFGQLANVEVVAERATKISSLRTEREDSPDLRHRYHTFLLDYLVRDIP